jgi:GT2 family glycosyltransferase
MKLSVQLVVWNGENYIRPLFESLRSQTFKDWELLVLDNDSKDNTLAMVSEFKDSIGVPVRIFQKNHNSGFAPAHNELFAAGNGDYVLVLNQDVILESEVFGDLARCLDDHPELGSASPRLMRLENNQKTSIIDSLGLAIDRKRKVYDIEAGKTWSGKKKNGEVFGVSGTVAIYRRSAVVEAAGRLFDPSYFAYQEDVDLAWQLQMKGYRSKILLDTTAYHHRSTRETEGKGIFGNIKNKRQQSLVARHNSYKNHLATLYKNEQYYNFILDLPFILWYELVKFCYFLVFDRGVLGGLIQIWRERSALRLERVRVQGGAKVSWRQFRSNIQ